MGRERRERGYTLIELMITVAILGVLSLLAVAGYRHWTRTAHLAEAENVVAHIRDAEEAFRSENGAYLDVSGNLGKGYSYPSQNPGAFVTEWGGACGWCKGAGWTGLPGHSSGAVNFGYSVIADAAIPASTRVGSITANGQALDLTNLAPNGQPWYFVEADANISGDGVSYTHVYAMSGSDQVYIDGDGN
jgi:prepilin-type N-terminal cleavage/methylation domain-containing protein